MHYTLVRGSSNQYWWPYDILKQIDLWLTPVDLYKTFEPTKYLHPFVIVVLVIKFSSIASSF